MPASVSSNMESRVRKPVRFASHPYGTPPPVLQAELLQPTPKRILAPPEILHATPKTAAPSTSVTLESPARSHACIAESRPWRLELAKRIVTITTLAEHQSIEGRTFDARVLHDPCNKRLRAHCGYHPTIIAGICSHRTLPSLLRDIKMHLQSSTVDMHIGLQCRSGKHRSVAMASILQNITGERIQVHHANANAWRDDCRTGRCHSCNSPADYEAALAIWQELPG